MFKKSEQSNIDYSANVTTIAAGTSVSGRIDMQCELHIDGEVNAEVHSSGAVKIGQTGVIVGDIHADSLSIAGKFTGSAECETIELIAGGEVEGKLTAGSLKIDAESSFEGESIRKNKNKSANKVVRMSSDVLPDIEKPGTPINH